MDSPKRGITMEREREKNKCAWIKRVNFGRSLGVQMMVLTIKFSEDHEYVQRNCAVISCSDSFFHSPLNFFSVLLLHF